MKETPVLSVIIPTYNTSDLLGRCIEYVLNQTLQEIEIIIIDDCSTDTTEQVINHYINKTDKKIKHIKNAKNSGIGYSRNIGIDLSEGEFIAFVDSDDWVDSSLFSTIIMKMQEENADIGIFGVKDEFDDCNSSKKRYDYKYNILDNEFALRLLSRSENNDVYISPMVTQKVYRKSFLKNNNIFFRTNCYFDDVEFTFMCFTYSCKLISVPDVFYHYYQRNGSLMHSFSKKHIDDFWEVMSHLKLMLENKHIWERYKQFYYKYFHKTLRSLMNTMFSSEQLVVNQKKYLLYFLNKSKTFSINELIEYWDIGYIRRLLL
ncbi:MAG: glycosyltransferase family 2 protein [Clostridiales bacterium]|nr:glycosyltransferase family 2 protein [Clostridiales bacterium]